MEFKRIIGRRMSYLLLSSLSLLTGCSEVNRLLGLSKDHTQISFLVAGQSNGTSGAQGTQGSLASATGRVTIHDTAGFDGIPTSSHPASTSVTWIYLGDTLAGTYSADIQFTNISRGNTTTDQWINNGWYKDIGPKARDSGSNAVLWVQGESDALNGHVDTYANMRKMILESRQYVPNLIWYIAIDGFTSTEPSDAQKRLVAEGLVFQGPDIDLMRLDHPDWFESGGYHAEFSNVEGFKGHAAGWNEILSANRRWYTG